MFNKNSIIVILGIGVLVLLFFLMSNDTGYKFVTKTVTVHKSDTIEIPIRVDTIIYKDKWVYQKDTINITTIIHDTLLLEKIVSEYFADFVYSDTICNDSNLIFVLSDTISQNQIKSRIYAYDITYMQNIIERKKTALFIGGGLDTKKNLEVNVALERNRLMYEVGYDFTQEAVKFRIKYKIFSK